MNRYLVFMAALEIGLVSATAQSSSAPPPGLRILQQVSQRYADAKSYHIEMVQERTISGDLAHRWSKGFYSAAEAPGNRYRFSGKTDRGSGLMVANGKTQWAYQIESNQYTEKPAAEKPASTDSELEMPELLEYSADLYLARDMAESLKKLAKSYKSAAKLPDETLTLDGHSIPCLVVRVTNADAKRISSRGNIFEKTIWIDKARMTVLKIVDHERFSTSPDQEIWIPADGETTSTYTVVDLDSPPDDKMFFTWTPPRNAKLIAEFPNPFTTGPSQWIGKPAPALTLTRADGSKVELASFKGKPVLIDFWATWCEPCVKSMPLLAKLYDETRSQGLVFLSADEDEDAPDATSFLEKKKYAWPNFHDDGSAMNTFGKARGIPHTILIDAKGVVVYDNVGFNEEDNKLLAAIAKLGPQYASLAPKPADPCVAAKKADGE